MPTFASLITDPFASHVVRAIVHLLSGSSLIAKTDSQVRSRKSAAWKARQGVMKSVFRDENNKNERSPSRITPEEFHLTARKFVQVVRDELGENEVRALVADKVASPVLQV
jgi:nucleolar protein 9